MRGTVRVVDAVVVALVLAIGVGASGVARPARESRLAPASVRTDCDPDTDRGSFHG
jgi:hypothetical protein